MRRIRFSIGLLLLILPILIFRHSSALSPASAANITVRPFLQELTVNPDDAAKQLQLSLSNNSSFTQVFHLSVTNFGALDETGGLAFEGSNVNQLSSRYGLAKWLKLETDTIELDPGQQATLNATITNDNALAPGAHYAAIITTASRPGQAPNQLTVTPKVSSLIFATKVGGQFYDIHLSSMSANGTLWRLPSAASLRLQSTGNTYIIPRGVVSVKQANAVLARGIINQQSSIVLPQTIRHFDVSLNNLASIKKGFLFSSYRVQADYRYDGVDQYATQSASYRIYNRATIVELIILAALGFAGLKYNNQAHHAARKLIGHSSKKHPRRK